MISKISGASLSMGEEIGTEHYPIYILHITGVLGIPQSIISPIQIRSFGTSEKVHSHRVMGIIGVLLRLGRLSVAYPMITKNEVNEIAKHKNH